MKESYKLQVTNRNKDKATLESYVADFAYIFKRTDAKRPIFDIFLNVVKNTSRTSEAVRRDQPERLVDALSDVMCWLLSFIAKVSDDRNRNAARFRLPMTLSQAIWQKYPNRCPVCFGGLFQLEAITNKLHQLSNISGLDHLPEAIMVRALGSRISKGSLDEIVQILRNHTNSHEYLLCHCPVIPGTEERTEGDGSFRLEKKAYDYVKKLVRRRYATQVHPPATWGVKDIEAMSHSIYRLNAQKSHLEDIVNHLQEEVGEIATALIDIYSYHPKLDPELTAEEDRLRREELAEEIADVISWIFSCLMKAKELFKSGARFTSSLGIQAVAPPDFGMADLIWARWGDRKLGHLRCNDCRQPDKCECGWLINPTNYIDTPQRLPARS